MKSPLHNGKRRINLLWLTVLFLCAGLAATAQYAEDSVKSVEVVQEPPAESTENTYTEEKDIPDFLPLEITDSLSLQIRNVPDSTLSRLQADNDFWYANAEFEKRKKKEDALTTPYVPIGQRGWVKTLLWLIILVVFAGVILFYLADSNMGLFRRNIRIIPAGENPEEMPEDIFAINYQKEIDKATGRGDYRMAVRLQFLRLLKQMAEKNIIRYQQDKTNFDYLMQLHNTGYYRDFFRITRHFEYSWYGQFAVTADAYQLIRQDIEQFENKR